MVSSIYGPSGHSQKNTGFDAKVADRAYNGRIGNAGRTGSTNKTGNAAQAEAAEQNGLTGNVKTKKFSPIESNSPLVPTAKEGYGTVIGNVELSDKAKEYYNKLKAKFHNMDFILVGKAEKGRVAANAAAYGNANKQVVLIDEEKLERMANDDSFRKKYEGIIEMSQTQLSGLKNSLASSGASIKNFGMSVDENGKTSFFATLEKASEAQNKILEKRNAAKKAEKAKELKKAAKEEKDERLEKMREKNRMQQDAINAKERMDDGSVQETDAREDLPEYIEFWADSPEELARTVSDYAFAGRESEIMPGDVGGHIDFRG